MTRSVSLYSSSVMASDVKVMGSGAHKGKIIARLSTSRLDYLIWEHTHAHQSYYYIYNISITLYIHACIVQYTCENTDNSLPTLHLLTVHSHCHCSIVTESFLVIDYHTCVTPFILLCELANECGAKPVGLPLHGLQLP